MLDPSAYQNEIYSVAAAPWSHVHPRNDHQLIFPLSGGRLLFVWCAYYVRRPSVINPTVFAEDSTVQDEVPCQISARVSSDRGRTWSDVILQENHGVDNAITRLAAGRRRTRRRT